MGTIASGEALFIPAGWLHHMVARAPSVSIALTTLPQEFADFNNWMLAPAKERLPFLSEDQWTIEELASALRVFLPALLEELGFGTDTTAPRYPLRLLVDASFGRAVRPELGIEATSWKCSKATAGRKHAALVAANMTAKRFKASISDENRVLYIMPYLETVISMLGRGNKSQIFGDALGFVETCLLRTTHR